MKPACINQSFIKTVLQGFAVICVCALVLSALGAGLVLGGVIDCGAITVMACVIHAAAVFLGAFLAARHSARQKLPAALAAGGCYLLVCLAVRLLLPNIQAGQGNALPGLLCIAGAALLGGLAGSRRPAPRRRKRR